MLVLTVVLGVVMFIALRSPLKDDIAWLLYVARRWMAGRELYVDVVEVNPPLIVWISAVPLELARWLDMPPQFTAMPVFVAVGARMRLVDRQLLRPRAGSSPRGCRFSPSSARCCCCCRRPIWDSASTCWLPPSCPTWRFSPARWTASGRRSIASLAAGALAGLGCALKPRYAAVFVVLECLALTRGLRPWRALPLAAAALCWATRGWWRSSVRPIWRAPCRWLWRCMRRPTCRS